MSCAFGWGEGKTFRIEQEIRTADGPLAAKISNVGGLLTLSDRRLVPRPGDVWRSAARAPEFLGL